MVSSRFPITFTWLFWTCSAAKQDHRIDASLIRASHIDCGGQHQVACETLQSGSSDRTVHGFLLLPETKSQWHAFPVGLRLDQHATAVRDKSTNRIVVLSIGLILTGAFAYWLSHNESQDERDRDDEIFSKSSPWEEAYQNAHGVQRDSYDLLFRTGIVPKMDRKSEVVNKGHIGRCVHVAEEMLREKPLKAWLENSENTRRVFEDKLADSYKDYTPVSTPATQEHLLKQSRQPSPFTQDRSPNFYESPSARSRVPEENAKVEEEKPVNKFRDDAEFSMGDIRGLPTAATVSTVAAVDCGKKSSPSSNSPASTVPVVDAERRKNDPTNSTSPRASPRQRIHVLPVMPATVPILEEPSESGSQSLQRPQTMSLPRSGSLRGNESEGTPVMLKFPGGRTSSSAWQTSAARSLNQSSNSLAAD